MCGRVSTTITRHEFALLFGLPLPDEFRPQPEVRPSEPLPLIRLNVGGRREVALVRWGLIPEWHRGEVGDWRAASFNARAEEAAEKPAFRTAFRRRRALLVVSSFYEWVEREKFMLRRRDGRPLVLAALWDRWSGPNGALESCSLLTCQANLEVSEVHERMPVVLLSRDWESWLNPLARPRELQALLRPLQPGILRAEPAAAPLPPAAAGLWPRHPGTPTPRAGGRRARK